MPERVNNSFTSFEFTERELLEASILSPLQEMRIQTLLAEIAEQKLELEFEIDKPLDRIIQDAHLKGQLGVLRTLLLASDESKLQLVRMVQEEQRMNSSHNFS